MRSADGRELDQLQGEQLAYYRALAADYLDQVLDLPGADELTEALDARPRGYRTPDELVAGPSSSTIRREIPDGTAYRLVKVPHQPADLETRLGELGWDIKVTATAGPFYWGAGRRAKGDADRLTVTG